MIFLVSKRWQILIKKSWFDFKKLNFNKECWGLRLEMMPTSILEKVLDRCGRFLKSIDFTPLHANREPRPLNLIAKFCPKIEHINTGPLDVSPSSISILADRCKDIKSFIGMHLTGKCDKALAKLFVENEGLEHFGINGNTGPFTGKCLRQLNRNSVRSIELSYCEGLDTRYVKVRH